LTAAPRDDAMGLALARGLDPHVSLVSLGPRFLPGRPTRVAARSANAPGRVWRGASGG
jgi:hypothetical protein